jgi:hypothetical protein
MAYAVVRVQDKCGYSVYSTRNSIQGSASTRRRDRRRYRTVTETALLYWDDDGLRRRAGRLRWRSLAADGNCDRLIARAQSRGNGGVDLILADNARS